MIPVLTDPELETALADLPGWTLQNGKLHRSYKFPDFAHAMGFMATCTPLIEKKNHHPEWANVYNRVTIHLVTHDSNGITKRDVELATLLESVAKRLL